MKYFCTLLLALCSLSMSANDESIKVEVIDIYKDNVLMLKTNQLTEKEHTAMDAEDLALVQSILETTKATSYSPVAPTPGGLFCVISLQDGKALPVRMTNNVFVVKKVDANNRESFQFYAPKDKDQLDKLAALLDKYGIQQ